MKQGPYPYVSLCRPVGLMLTQSLMISLHTASAGISSFQNIGKEKSAKRQACNKSGMWEVMVNPS